MMWNQTLKKNICGRNVVKMGGEGGGGQNIEKRNIKYQSGKDEGLFFATY